MIDPRTAALIVFWTFAALVAYAYAVYPPLVWALSRLFGRRDRPPADVGLELPTASLVIAAFNEEAVIEGRLRNALAMNYPPGLLEIVVGSDGSTDATAAIVARYADQGVRLLDFPVNRGKATVLNEALAEARGEIVLMSDANTLFDPDAALRLARWFADPEVGAVCGEVLFEDPATGRNADGLYWRYEVFLKRCEGRLGALLGANGPIYAIRRPLYQRIPTGTIIDDFVIPLLARLQSGCAIIYDREAVAREESAPDVGAEFHRRARIGAGGFQSLGMLWRLLDPRQGWVAFTFLSHKLLRWLGPFFLLGLLASNLMLLDLPFYQAALAAQGAFYAASLAAAWLPARGPLARPMRLALLFTSMNAALLVGFWRWARGSQKAAWKRTARVAEVEGAVR